MRINFFGGPGSGKSTTAAYIYSCLKDMQYSCELVREVVKDLAYEGKPLKDYDQLLYFAKQLHQEFFYLENGCDVIVTDSPLLLNNIYAVKGDFPGADQMCEITKIFRENYSEINIFLDRGNRFYNPHGRYQSKDSALSIDKIVLDNAKEIARFDSSEKIKILNYVTKELNKNDIKPRSFK